MKVILSIDPIYFPLTGIGRYTYELARNLREIPEIDQLQFFSNCSLVRKLPEYEVNSKTPSLNSVTLRRSFIKVPGILGAYTAALGAAKIYALRNHADHIFHGPNFDLPSFNGRKVCTIHDLSVFTWSHCHPPARVNKMRKEIEHTLRNADLLITDTEYTRQEVAEFFAWPLNKISAVPLASSGDFYPRPSTELIPALQNYGLNLGGYSLYVGTIEPRKNLETLLEAYRQLPVSIRTQWPLVIIGHRGWNSDKLHERISLAQQEGWARYLGFVNADDLPKFFAAARLFVFPSLYEGFGLPVLEAMASGIPVVCSNSSTLPEVSGDAAAMCEALDIDALSQLIMRGLEDETWRSDAVRKGLLQSAQFSWQRCAQETAGVYKKLAA